MLLSRTYRIYHFQHEQRPAEPDAGDLDDCPRDNHRQLVPARSCICHVATHPWRGLNGSGRSAQAANAVGNFFCLSAGLGIIAGRVQLEVDHDHNHRHTSGNLYGDGECHLRLGDQDDDGPVHSAVGKNFRS